MFLVMWLLVSLLEGFTRTQVSTLAVRDNLLIAGGFQGELICKYLDRPGVSFCMRTTYDDNAITNAIDIYGSRSGAVHFTASNNDCGVRDFDMERFQLVKHFSYPWPHTSLSPDGKIIAIVGDNPDGMLVDSQTERLLHTCEGTWISLLHLHGIPMGTPLPLGTKTKLAVYATRGCCLHLLLYSRKSWCYSFHPLYI
ncbi:uncharacterized protein [Primulina eburnea]|uniref:uncharacterized protein n=1 Tax=Primulina eburnea TaxID=1245227 RepID=UPI003C6C0D04